MFECITWIFLINFVSHWPILVTPQLQTTHRKKPTSPLSFFCPFPFSLSSFFSLSFSLSLSVYYLLCLSFSFPLSLLSISFSISFSFTSLTHSFHFSSPSLFLCHPLSLSISLSPTLFLFLSLPLFFNLALLFHYTEENLHYKSKFPWKDLQFLLQFCTEFDGSIKTFASTARFI